MVLRTFLLVAAAAAAQTGDLGQSWVGLLVPSDCTVKPSKTRATDEADLTVTSRVTTPNVDQSGTRGSSTALDRTAQAPTSKSVAPRTGNVLDIKGAGRGAGEWNAARKQAQGLTAACLVTAETRAFALLMPDGSVVPLDDLANQAVQQHLPAFPAGGAKRVLRVAIEGKKHDGKLALTSVEF